MVLISDETQNQMLYHSVVLNLLGKISLASILLYN